MANSYAYRSYRENWQGYLFAFYQAEFSIEKVIKRKGGKLYVRWKGFDNLFNRWFGKKCIK